VLQGRLSDWIVFGSSNPGPVIFIFAPLDERRELRERHPPADLNSTEEAQPQVLEQSSGGLIHHWRSGGGVFHQVPFAHPNR
jgi:hypothetical protein